ncbi:MAG: hypothetical protein WBK27_00495 [Bacteroidales bacterium]
METSVKKLIEKLDKAANDMMDIANDMMDIGCCIIYIILLAGIIIYCIILLGALFG